MKAELVPENGGRPIPIVRDVTVVGRKESCDVVVNDPSVSKLHCVLVRTSGLLLLRDLATTNGTKVKGQRVRWAALLPGDRVSLGKYKLRIYLGSDDVPSPSERWGDPGLQSIQGSAFASLTPPRNDVVRLDESAEPMLLGEDDLMLDDGAPISPSESLPIPASRAGDHEEVAPELFKLDLD